MGQNKAIGFLLFPKPFRQGDLPEYSSPPSDTWVMSGTAGDLSSLGTWQQTDGQ